MGILIEMLQFAILMSFMLPPEIKKSNLVLTFSKPWLRGKSIQLLFKPRYNLKGSFAYILKCAIMQIQRELTKQMNAHSIIAIYYPLPMLTGMYLGEHERVAFAKASCCGV